MPDYSALKNKYGDFCLFGEPAVNFTTYRAGGRAEALVKPGTAEDLAWLQEWCRANGAPLLVLGRGSNVLVSDRGLPGVTALTERLARVEVKGEIIEAQAGALWDEVARLSAENGLSGFEKTSGIPGSVGGAVRMNAGAFGQETFDRLVSVQVLGQDGAVLTLQKRDLKYGYRRVEGLAGRAVLSASFSFDAGDRGVLIQDRSCVLAARSAKQPLEFPSAGSVFKRPQGDYASRLIDAAGLKGFKLGGAEVSAKHAGFIVNSGGATAADIYALMREVRERVKAKTGVQLELEQILLGEF